MKVVLFCGGLGMRLREYSEAIPKPLVSVGHRPILWHIMKYYAHYGHTEFILCLGWKGEAIKEYFLNYNECLSNDFVLTGGGGGVRLLSSDIENWNITFVDSGLHSNIGQRLKAVQKHVQGEQTFLANYADGLSDLPLSDVIDFHRQTNAMATFMTVRPMQSFHCVASNVDGTVREISPIADSGLRINAGYFVFEQEIFDQIHEGEELIMEPFSRIISQKRLFAFPHDGFYGCMDTFKEKQQLDDMHAQGDTPWEVWRTPAPGLKETEFSSQHTASSFPARKAPVPR